MNFELTEERRMLRDTLRRFFADGPVEPWAGLAELGVIGALFSEEQGGFGGTGFDLAVVFEELGRADLALPLIEAALVPGLLLAAAGRETAPLVAGEVRYAFAHAELDARYDMDSVETRAEGDRLSGRKTVVIGAGAARSLIVSARAGAEGGIGLWLVEPEAKGLSLTGYTTADGLPGAELELQDVPGEPLLADALPAIEAATAAATVALCAQTLGAMEIAAEMTRDYLTQRKQFGRPIGSFQALAHRLVDVMLALEQTRSAVILAAGHLEAASVERDRYVSAAKNLVGRSARLVAEEAIQMHGGIGMTEEYALGRYAKRIVMADHRYGDTDWHLERFIELSA